MLQQNIVTESSCGIQECKEFLCKCVKYALNWRKAIVVLNFDKQIVRHSKNVYNFEKTFVK